MLEESNLRPLRSFTFDDFNPHTPELRAIFDHVRTYARQFAQGWLIFEGPFGCGKTHLAAAIGNSLLERDKPVLFAFVPDLLDELQALSGDERFAEQYEYLRKIQGVEYLILDALGAEQQSLWSAEKLVQILSYRSQRMVPTIITLNAPLASQPPAIRSLLSDKFLCRHIRMQGPDFRLLPMALRFRRHSK